jgi:hypothetical protein
MIIATDLECQTLRRLNFGGAKTVSLVLGKVEISSPLPENFSSLQGGCLAQVKINRCRSR